MKALEVRDLAPPAAPPQIHEPQVARRRQDPWQRRLGVRRGFEGGEHPVYWIYGFKTGTFWPFVPTGEKQERDNARELELKAKLEPELPVEKDLSKWLALFDAPI